LWWAVSTIHPSITGISYAQHAIFELNFHTVGVGTSNVNLYGTFLSDSNIDPISHDFVNGSITVVGGYTDLSVTNIGIVGQDLRGIYANDTYVNGEQYYYPVEVTLRNDGDIDAEHFYVKLEVYWVNGSTTEDLAEMLVSSLQGGSSVVVTFTSLYHPIHTGYYRLIVTADSRDDVAESNETNNVLVLDKILVTVIGDINCDGVVNILDGVRISLAWNSTLGDDAWNDRADINHDGHIDILDGVRMGLHWGENW
jgi:hypothetical protein